MYGMEYSHRNSEVLRNRLCYRSKSITKDSVAMSTKLSTKNDSTYSTRITSACRAIFLRSQFLFEVPTLHKDSSRPRDL